MARTYQLKVSIEPRLAEGFKARCQSGGISMAERLSQLLETETGAKPTVREKGHFSLDTRKQRRDATQKAAILVEAIKDREEAYRDSIPCNLQGGLGYEAAEQAIDALDQAACLLNDAF
jgi:hypothetical protein